MQVWKKKLLVHRASLQQWPARRVTGQARLGQVTGAGWARSLRVLPTRSIERTDGYKNTENRLTFCLQRHDASKQISNSDPREHAVFFSFTTCTRTVCLQSRSVNSAAGSTPSKSSRTGGDDAHDRWPWLPLSQVIRFIRCWFGVRAQRVRHSSQQGWQTGSWSSLA